MSNKVVATILLIGMLLLTLGVFRTLGANNDPAPSPQKTTIKAPTITMPTGGETEDD